jgi:hypothetical protein
MKTYKARFNQLVKQLKEDIIVNERNSAKNI